MKNVLKKREREGGKKSLFAGQFSAITVSQSLSLSKKVDRKQTNRVPLW